MRVPEFASVSIFAEDIRFEQNGQVTIVGIFPDNVGLPELPAIMSKLAVYTRSVFSTEVEITDDLVCVLLAPDGSELSKNVTSKDALASAMQDSKAQGGSMLTMLSQMVATPFPVPYPGRITLVARYGQQEVLSGFLHLSVRPPESTS